MMIQRYKETELASYVIKYLNDFKRFDIYQEVRLDRFGKIADIVAIDGNLAWVIECKTSFTLTLLEQADYWREYANYVSIAVPVRRQTNVDFKLKLLNILGVGYLKCHDSGCVFDVKKPKLNRKKSSYLKKFLHPYQKIMVPAGSVGGGYYTPFGETARAVQRYVKFHRGCTMKEIVDNVKTHYECPATAVSCLRRWIDMGVIKNIRVDKTEKKWKYYHDA